MGPRGRKEVSQSIQYLGEAEASLFSNTTPPSGTHRSMRMKRLPNVCTMKTKNWLSSENPPTALPSGIGTELALLF